MRIMGIDFGDARVGIAVSDISETVSTAVGTIKVNGMADTVTKTAEKSKELQAELFVVGLPKNMNGSESYRVERTKKFAALLNEKTGIEVRFFDERLTTVLAHGYLNESGINGRKRKTVIDALSAQIILQDFLDKEKMKK